MDTPSLVFFGIGVLKLVQQLLKGHIIPMKPSPQLRELTLSCLLDGFHLTYLLLIKKLHLLQADT
jgi:hypothetical protein